MCFAEGKIHSKTLKHRLKEKKYWKCASLFWAGFAAWHIFGILMDNGSKHKFWDVVIFPVQPQWSLIAANLKIQQNKCQDLVSVLYLTAAASKTPFYTESQGAF